MDGEDASKFIRYRNLLRATDRIENVKRLAYAMLARVKELTCALPDGARPHRHLFSDVETNASDRPHARVSHAPAGPQAHHHGHAAHRRKERLPALGWVVNYDRWRSTVSWRRPSAVRRASSWTARTPRSSSRTAAVPGVSDWYLDRLVKLGVRRSPSWSAA